MSEKLLRGFFKLNGRSPPSKGMAVVLIATTLQLTSNVQRGVTTAAMI